ncbi:MAG TPA: 50S ribosomal protein L24e [Candidatus Nanoarchaeia archaeon]|nr:50S ribosomal protein L24e [Candidatus Nanoarchaeia archaeon]
MPRCAFCGTELRPGTGTMFIYATGKVSYFCSSKCRKNTLKLKRKPLRTRWTEEFRKEHKKGAAAQAGKKGAS